MARRSRLLSPTRLLRRSALYKGFLGGHRGWAIIGAFLWGPRLVRRMLGRRTEVLTTEVLKPGDAVQLTTIPRLTRQQRHDARHG